MFFVTSLKNVSMSQFFLFQRAETLLRTLRKTGELEKVCGGRKQPGGFLYKRSNCWGGTTCLSLKGEWCNDSILKEIIFGFRHTHDKKYAIWKIKSLLIYKISQVSEWFCLLAKKISFQPASPLALLRIFLLIDMGKARVRVGGYDIYFFLLYFCIFYWYIL